MRAKTSDFLKVLNRARPEKVVEKKTITYVPKVRCCSSKIPRIDHTFYFPPFFARGKTFTPTI
jgi:hypothetical protein